MSILLVGKRVETCFLYEFFNSKKINNKRGNTMGTENSNEDIKRLQNKILVG
jgi:hypothetical protein